MKKLSVRSSLTLWYTALVVLLLGLTAGITYPVLVRGLHGEVDASLKLAAHQAANIVREDDGRLTFGDKEEDQVLPARLVSEGYAIRLIGRAGTMSDGFGAVDLLPAPSSTKKRGFQTIRTENGRWRIYTISAGNGGALIQAGESLTRTEETVTQLTRIYLVTLPAAALLAVFLGFFLAGRALRPVDRVTKLATAIGAEDLSGRLNLDLPDDEVGRLAATFDKMLDRLEAGFSREREFTADAAHELRTPLAAMTGEMEIALSRARSADEYRDAMESSQRQLHRLSTLVEELLVLARLESEGPRKDGERILLPEIIESVGEQLLPLARAKGVTVQLGIEQNLVVEGDPGQLIRLFLNLLDNAIKYSPEGAEVKVRATGTHGPGGEIMVTVADSGPGIDSAHLPHIFRRFYRADKSRAREGGQTGLGLAIAERIVKSHRGTITAESSAAGAVFKLTLPSA